MLDEDYDTKSVEELKDVEVTTIPMQPVDMVKNMYYMGGQNINEISAINNNTTNPDSSMNTTQIDLIKKLSDPVADPYNVFKPVTENRTNQVQ